MDCQSLDNFGSPCGLCRTCLSNEIKRLESELVIQNNELLSRRQGEGAVLDLADYAWTILCNVDWLRQPADWVKAARKFGNDLNEMKRSRIPATPPDDAHPTENGVAGVYCGECKLPQGSRKHGEPAVVPEVMGRSGNPIVQDGHIVRLSKKDKCETCMHTYLPVISVAGSGAARLIDAEVDEVKYFRSVDCCEYRKVINGRVIEEIIHVDCRLADGRSWRGTESAWNRVTRAEYESAKQPAVPVVEQWHGTAGDELDTMMEKRKVEPAVKVEAWVKPSTIDNMAILQLQQRVEKLERKQL